MRWLLEPNIRPGLIILMLQTKMDQNFFISAEDFVPSGLAGIDREPFELFLILEARLLDLRKFWDWKNLYTEEGVYWVPASPNQKDPYKEASLFFDDAQLMRTRFERLEHPRIHIQTPPSRTVHMVSNVIVETADNEAGEYLISSTMSMTEYRQDTQRIFSGYQFHRLVKTKDSFQIRLKQVNLVNCDSAFEAMAVPI